MNTKASKKNKTFYLLINCNEAGQPKINVVSCLPGEDQELGLYTQRLDCERVEFVECNETCDIIADEEAHAVSDNPVFKIINTYYPGGQLITGHFMVGKQITEKDGNIRTIGFSTVDELMKEIPTIGTVTLVGYTE